MQTALIAETTTAPMRKAGVSGRWRARLIEADVQGSSGYYSAAVLQRDGAKAFPAGTHVYYDHPTESEAYERPERSVKDLAGALIEDAYYEDGPDGKGLFARVQFFPDYINTIEAMAEHIPVEMSIRAAGTIEESEAGRIVTSIVHGVSVDIVTRAGAGGRLIRMTEAAKPAVVQAAAPQVAQLSETDKTMMTNLGTGITALTETMGKLVTFMEENKAKKEEAAKLTVGQVSAKLVESGLPAASQKRLAEAYKDGDDLDKAITDEAAYVAALTEAAKGTAKKPATRTAQVPGTVETDEDKEGTDDKKELEESTAAFANLFGN